MDNQEGPRKKARRSSLTTSIGDLLATGKYSDLEIRCDGRSFIVHRNIVCGRSDVMDKECGGGFLEAQARIIEHSVFDSSAVDRMLQFMYRNDYQLGTACPTIEDRNTATRDTIAASSPASGTTDEETAASTMAEADAEDELVAHVYVYAIADYYDLPALQNLAVTKFNSSADKWESISTEALVELAAVVYSNTTREATDLRDELFSLVWDNQLFSFDSPVFMHALATRAELQELAVDIVAKTNMRHRACEDMLEAHEGAEVERSNKVDALEEELTLRRRDIQDLLRFAELPTCPRCEAVDAVGRPFSYDLSKRSRDKGYAATCRHCSKRWTR